MSKAKSPTFMDVRLISGFLNYFVVSPEKFHTDIFNLNSCFTSKNWEIRIHSKMATQERLHKSLEALRLCHTINLLTKPGMTPEVYNSNYPCNIITLRHFIVILTFYRKKEKIHHCYVVSETFSNPTIKVSANFQMLLGVTIETFLKLCDDTDADIRMTSDECLNRIIRAVSVGHIGKIQIELHNEIKRNGPSRSLRAALLRFSQLAHHIRPHKGKPYVINLFPSIIRIADRTEEAVHETLAISLPKILKSLGIFAPDNDIKALLKAFLQNIIKPSAAIRRTSSSCILSICMHSRRPYVFVKFCINYLLDILIPIDINQNSCLVLGALHCLKVLLPYIKNVGTTNENIGYSKDVEIIQPIAAKKLLQVYELCIHYITSNDHNIINASLDTLNILLLNATDELQEKILNPTGIDRCRIHKTLSVNNFRSPSQLSVATNVTSPEENLFSECELTETVETDIEKWIGESKLSVINMPHLKHNDKPDSSDTLTRSQNESNALVRYYENSPRLPESFSLNIKSSSITDNLDKFSDRSSEESITASEEKLLEGDNGFYEVDVGDYLDKSIPLLYCIRLITKSFLLSGVKNKHLSDKTVRVSVKSSALTCLSSIFRLYPYGFFIYLDKNYSPSVEGSSRISSQKIDEIMLLADHSDPQLRGIARSVASDVVGTILNKTNLDMDLWSKYLQDHMLSTGTQIDSTSFFGIKHFVNIWVKGLEDENSNCLRQTLLSLKTSLNLLSESSACHDILPIFDIIPILVNNPYWLVKVALCELVSKIPYITIYHITGNSLFQRKVIYNVLFEFLKDADQRIRSAASTAILEIMEHLYFDDYHPKENAVTTKGIYFVGKYLTGLSNKNAEKNLYWTHFVENMPFPYSQISNAPCDKIDYLLSKIVNKLYTSFLETNSKYFIHGCIEALSTLSNKYPCTIYRLAWGITDNYKRNTADTMSPDNLKDLLGLCISLSNTSVHIYDIPFLVNLMNLTMNLYAGYAMASVKPVDVTEKTSKTWSMYTNESLKSLSDQYLLHVIKLLNIFHHVINDMVPTAPQSKTVLPHLPSSGTMSPIKRRKNDDKKLPLGPARIVMEKDEKIDKKDIKMTGIGCFAGSQHYMRVFEMLRSAFINYKISLDPGSSESFIELMRKTIHSLCVIMEIGTLNEFGRISEEILNYLKTNFPLDRTLTVQCVQQLLKCLFGTNLTANFGDIIDDAIRDEKDENYSFYHNIFQKPYEETSSCINSLSTISKVECDGDSTVMGYLHRKDVKKTAAISRTSDKTLANYIRIFEPMVINSLKQYTVTSDVVFQCYVLKLLSQLLQLRVNYCLLDSEQVFKDFVLKQFQYIEEGLVPHSEEIIPKIFQFLVHLSYSKQHSKSIIDIPKIIQLCDGLMASGQDPKTHCIPALEPIVEDVFLIRSRSNTTDMKELETTREVVLSMLLRLFEYKEVIDLVTLVLDDSKYCTDDTEKWLRWSGQVVNVFLQMLRQDKIRINDRETFVSLKKFIFALNPNVFRPPDDVIVMLFQTPPSIQDDQILNRWLSKVILLLFIISPLKEEVLLAKINSIKSEFSPGSIFENFTVTADPLNVYNNANAFQNISEEAIIARLIFRVVSKASTHILRNGSNSDAFFVSLFSTFLMYCSHIFQSGSLCKVSQVAVSLLTQSTHGDINVDMMNRNFLQVRKTHPMLTFQWSHILSVLNYNLLHFWSSIISSKENAINDCLVQTGGTVVFCDYLSENTSETKQLSWILSEHSNKLVNLVDEVPVSEFISFVHRNATLSKVFVASITQNCLNYQDPVFKTRIIKCIENCHISQTGAAIKLLIPKMLCNRQIAISRMVAHLASRKIEFLFTLPNEEVLTQLSKEDLFIIKEELNVRNLAKKHETLISLLNKLLVRYYDMSPLEFSQTRLVNPEYIRKLDINKKWFLSQIQGKYQDGILRKETSIVMEKLEYNELISFMSSGDFNKIIFRDCIERGVTLLKEKDLKEEPPLLKATVDNILKDVSRIVNELCGSHQVFSTDIQPNHYTVQIQELFEDESFSTLIQNLCFSLSALMNHLYQLPTLQLSEVDSENIAKFAVIALEYINFILVVDKQGLNINYLEVLLDCSNEVLKQTQFCSFLGLDVNISWLCSAVNSIHCLAEYLLKNDNPLPSVEKNVLQCLSENVEVNQAQKSCHNLYTLTSWLYKIQNKYVKIPMFLLYRIRSLIVSLARLPLLNSYNLVPGKVWKLGWQPELTGKFFTQVPPLPIAMLQEIDVLEEYIFRTTLLDWTTRQQFEETWMCFLSVLCTPLDNLDSADINIARRASSLAIKAITAQLLQTLRYPVLGNKNVSKFMHVSRNMPIRDTTISTKKLKIIQNNIESKYNDLCNNYITEEIRNVFSCKNFEKISEQYSYGQLSIRYFLVPANIGQEKSESYAEVMYKKRMMLLEECGLDVNSCLQFLLDYFTQLMKPESAVTDIRILHETIRAALYISDLFTDKTQFSWMLEMFLDLSKVHAVEDELIHQYLIVGICKAVGVLTPDLEVYEQIKKLLVQFLKSPFLPTRISCLYGLLYILEGCLLSNIAIGGISEELQLILPCAVEYIQIHLNVNNPVLYRSQEHTMLVWSLAFYLMENVDEVHMESNFVISTLQVAIAQVQKKAIDYVDKCVIKGLERLLLIKPIYILEKIGKILQKLALEKMRDENPSISILGVQLLVTYMYVDCWEHLEKPDPDSEQSSPDHLVQTIEKISAIFERIKKSYVNEVEMLCSILPTILRDFFSPSDILTKVIGEFLSSQQPHPKLMSGVVFQVFESAIQLNQLSLLQDWVVFSLSNFTQSFSNMATWCLTCFFISASSNEWLRAFFPYVQNRGGRYEYEDKKIFCIAGSDFYKNLTNDNQRKTFVDNFMKVKDHADMPFNDLLSSL